MRKHATNHYTHIGLETAQNAIVRRSGATQAKTHATLPEAKQTKLDSVVTVMDGKGYSVNGCKVTIRYRLFPRTSEDLTGETICAIL